MFGSAYLASPGCGFFVFVYAEGPEVPPSAHGPGTSPIGSATTRDAKVDVPSAAVHMYIPNLPKVATWRNALVISGC